MRIIGNNPAADNAEITAVASGTMANGNTVIVNADGTVSVVAATSASTGSEAVYETAEVGFNTAVFDSSNNKVIIVYRTNTPLMKYVVGTVSGSSISFSSPATAMSSDNQQLASVFDSANNRIVVVFRNGNDSSHGYAIVGSLSGTTVSWGSATEFSNNIVAEMGVAFDSTANKVVISYRNYGNSSYGTSVIGTISGTSISFGSPVVFQSYATNHISTTFDSNSNKVVISYRDNSSLGYGEAVVGTVSGTGISFGSPTVFSTQTTGGISETATAFDSNANKVVVAWQDGTDGNKGAAVVGSVSGTNISFGGKVFFELGSTTYIEAVFNTSANKIVIAYRDTSNSSYGTIVSGAVSGTSITFETPTVFNAGSSGYIGMCFDSNANKSVVAYTDAGNGGDGTAITFTSSSTNITAENFIGFANGAASDTGTARVQIGSGINTAQSSLTAGQQYFVQTDGTIGLTAADPSVIAGTAISATEIIVKG